MQKSLTQRTRFKEGKTNYYTRKKLLTNYEKIVRVSLIKKNNYYCSSIIYTPEIEKPDINKEYTESRWIQNKQGQTLKANTSDCFVFGSFFAKKLISFCKENPTLIKDKIIVLSLNRSKKIVFRPFLKGLLGELRRKSAQQIIEKFRWPKDIDATTQFEKSLEKFKQSNKHSSRYLADKVDLSAYFYK